MSEFTKFVGVLVIAFALSWLAASITEPRWEEVARSADTVPASPPRPEPSESYPTLIVCLEMMDCEPVIEAVAGKRCGRVTHPWSESPDTVYLECVEAAETVAVEAP